ncbi:NUDIX hydrolase [Bacillus sp. Bva_UNVM-123]|uniref:NUDIX hydrolase n=1 Tax=Bacillus sp. Bva_UNVM-123 TaxID=2829798 RepID=UPI00391F0658
MQKWNTLKSEYLHNSPFGNIRKDKCKLPNGLVIDEYYVNEYADWVNAIVITKENQIVLVEQYRYAGNDFYLEIPAGKREGNESHEEGLIREVREETGYISLTNPILLGEFMVNPATQNNRVKTYLIVNAFRKYEQQLDDTEQINVRLIDFEEMANLIWTNEIKTQLFTVSAYFMAKDYLEKRRK